jgi:NAD-dependent dihydropyrimidine dehydrogenase PreA subunit
MVYQFHPDEDGEPCWGGIFEEFVMVGVYVELAESVGEVRLEECWLQGDCVDYCQVSGKLMSIEQRNRDVVGLYPPCTP